MFFAHFTALIELTEEASGYTLHIANKHKETDILYQKVKRFNSLN